MYSLQKLHFSIQKKYWFKQKKKQTKKKHKTQDIQQKDKYKDKQPNVQSTLNWCLLLKQTQLPVTFSIHGPWIILTLIKYELVHNTDSKWTAILVINSHTFSRL